MELARKVREFSKLTSWKMMRKMGKRSIQAYLNFERQSNKLSLKDYFSLQSIYYEAGGTDFESLAKEFINKD